MADVPVELTVRTGGSSWLQLISAGAWTKLDHWDGYARSVDFPATTAELKADGSLRFHGPVDLRRELPGGGDRG
ncbi:hypothetical protein [Amycolatopsis kentuckyensis]|uniref:hypothetical protein n=1 Tax=Amycolatopsis kentuckyensis TaxID=218823 RepID=UPI0035638C4B